MAKNLQELLDQELDEDYRKRYVYSEESRAKISEAVKRRWQDPAYRAKMEEVTRDGLSKEARAKISQAKKGKPAHNKGKGKRIMTPNGEFVSLTAVAQAAGVRPSTVCEWMKKWPEHYYYIKEQ